MSTQPITTVNLPCASCAHREVCGIRPDIADWKVELPEVHAAITVSAVVTIDCRHHLAAAVPVDVSPVVRDFVALERQVAAELAAVGLDTASSEPAAAPARRGLSEASRQRLRESGRKGGKNRPTYAREPFFDALRRTRTFAEAGAILGETAYIVGKRVRTLRSRNELPADLAKRQWYAGGVVDWDRVETIAAARAHPTLRAAATALGIKSSSLLNRLDVMSAEGSLPADVARRRRGPQGTSSGPAAPAPARSVDRPVEAVAPAAEAAPVAPVAPVAPPLVVTRKSAAAPAQPPAKQPAQPTAAARQEVQEVQAVPEVPEVPKVPKRVVELPTPEWPAPLPASAAAVVQDDFAERRVQQAREAAERSWRERHPEGVAG